MTIPSLFANKRTQKVSIITLGLAGVIATAYTLAPVSGAYFFDNKQVNLSNSVATFGLEMSDGNGTRLSGNYEISASNLLPGDSRHYAVTLKNVGSVSGHLYATLSTRNISYNPNNMSERQLSLLSYALDGRGLFQYDEASGSYSNINLGMLEPGQTMDVVINQDMDSMADNQWQGTTVNDMISFNLSQI